MRSIIYGGERYGSSQYITICKAKLNRIVYINEISPFFNCENSVGKGENLSAFFIFHMYIYLNDVHDFLKSSHIQCLPTISEMFETKLNVFLKLFAILYADDTVLYY